MLYTRGSTTRRQTNPPHFNSSRLNTYSYVVHFVECDISHCDSCDDDGCLLCEDGYFTHTTDTCEGLLDSTVTPSLLYMCDLSSGAYVKPLLSTFQIVYNDTYGWKILSFHEAP